MSEREFWLEMAYACDNPSCEFEAPFFLEVGCEGPRDEERPPPPELLHAWTMLRPESFPPPLKTVPHTSSGRLVVPVPFFSGRCPRCRDEEGVYPLGFLHHVRWGEDRVIDPPGRGMPDASVFLYPPDGGRNPDACGIPVCPWNGEVVPRRG